MKMKVVKFYVDEYGEGTIFLNEEEQVIGIVSSNDATWRHEYLDPILVRVGVDVEVHHIPEEEVVSMLKAYWG